MTCGLISGADQICFYTPETTYNTYVEPSGTDVLKVLSSSIKPTQERIDNLSHTGSRSREGRIRGKAGGDWECSFYITPNGTAGNAPPHIDNILRAAFGGTPASGGGTYTYVLDSSAAIVSGQFVRFASNANSQFCEWANGCSIGRVTVSHSSGESAIITVSGSFANYGKIEGTPVTSGTAAASATSVALPSGDAHLIKAGARIKFVGDTGTSNAGYLVTAVSDDGLTLTISPALATGTANGAAITPVVTHTATTPSGTFSGSPLLAISYGLTVGGSAIDYISASVEIDTGQRLLDDEANSEYPTCIYAVPRIVDLNFEVNRKDTSAGLDGPGWVGTTRAVSWRLGRDVSTERMTFSLPACDISPAENNIDGSDKATASFNAAALKNSADDDEMTAYLD